ncbi:MAG: fibrobacter succinogenes major paralogous domain-containing protein [Fibromonadales bacterium]|nr:fibrobacter succinogenes major paralogous domain-containing protein [Fibromonadales bacterium]
MNKSVLSYLAIAALAITATAQSVEWTASSTLAPQGKTRYDAANLGNGDNSNTWCEGVKGQGIGERVNAKITGFANSHVKSLVIVNGFARNQTTWQNNSRIKKLRLHVGDRHLSDFNVSDNIKPQTINLPETLPLSTNKLDLSFEIMEVYPGSKYDDLCVTGISFDIYAVDSRDAQTYRIVKIGNKTWMAQNLNFKAADSKCYDNKDSNCAKYGRLYNWEAAMKACPTGWRVPNNEEWKALVKFAGGEKKLKAKSGWNKIEDADGEYDMNGTDDFGFSALPGGSGNSNGNFELVGYYGGWWSSDKGGSGSNRTYGQDIYYSDEFFDFFSTVKPNLYSVRCVKD